MWRWAQDHPTRAAAVATVVLSWLALAGVPEVVVGGLGTILAAVIGTTVWGAVTPVRRVAGHVQAAAEKAAVDVATRLDRDVAGPAGQLGDAATGVAIEAAQDATTAILSAAGIKRRDRRSDP